MSAGDNKTAMKYLKLGMNRDYYSIAFRRYRSEILRQYLGPVLTGCVVLLAAVWVFRKIRSRSADKKEGGDPA